jgi:hypothetical protein
MNEASEFELPSTDDELRFFEEMDTSVAEMEMIYDLLDILDRAMNNQRFTEKTKELIITLISQLKNSNCLNDA